MVRGYTWSEKQNIMETVELGIVEECEYEYLGFRINQNGNCTLQIPISKEVEQNKEKQWL